MDTKNYVGSPSKALFGTTLGFFFGSAAVSLFGPFHDLFASSMHLSPAQVGLLIAIPSLTGSLLRIPFGGWVSSTGGKKPFMILLILSVIGLLGMSFLLGGCYPGKMDGMYPLVLFLGCLCGCGIATFSVGIGQTSYWFKRNKQGTALGIFGGAGTLAPGVFALLLSVTMHALSVTAIYWIWTVILIIGTILFYIFGKNAPFFQFLKKGQKREEAQANAKVAGEELFPAGGLKESLTVSAKVPATWMLTIIYFCSFGGFLALTAWLPTFFNKFFSTDSVIAGVVAAGFSILSALVRIPSGKWSDKIGGEKMIIYSMIVLLVGALIMIFTSIETISIIGSALIGISFGMCNAATFKLVPKYIPQAVGGASGWVGGFGAFGGFLIPQISSVFIERQGHEGYSNSFWVFVSLAIINLLLIIFGLILPNKKKMEESAAKATSTATAK